MSSMSNRGYTLVELIIVISLLLLISMPIVAYNNYENFTTEFAIRRYVSDIRYVYNKNTFGDIDCCLKYVYEDKLSTKKVIGYSVSERNVAKKTVYFPNNLEISGETDDLLKFNRNGSLKIKGETIKIKNIKTMDYYKITIVPISGRVAIYKNENEE